MFFWRCFLTLSLCGFLFACTAPQQTIKTVEPPTAVSTPTVAIEELPCAEISNAELFTITYTTGSLYRSGAALPKMEGLACLEVLADWLKDFPERAWLIDVGGEDGHGFDPMKLAEKRQELLLRFFQRKGINTSEWRWQTAPSQTTQLQFTSST